jgi:para-nitrobenzyl esterase
MTTSRRFLLRAAPAVLGALASGGAARPGPSHDPDLVVRTRAGLVRGQARDGARVFLGIPYGRVPARFRPAQPSAPWSGVRAATRFGPVAVQRLGEVADRLVSSEQCLSLNVWSPSAAERAAAVASSGASSGSSPGALLPVLVWVHGGANVSGASSQPIYDGARFARSGVVCVTLNYRLGVFGFLELGATLGAGYHGSGNNALRDQMLALAWVRDNIACFGGDPRRVTLAGESAGAKDVGALLAAPSARGLFHRVILESGGGRTVLSMQAAQAVSLRYLNLLGLRRSHAAHLLVMDTERLIEAQHALMLDEPYSYPLRPLVDGGLLPEMPESAIALGCAVRTPVLLGTNRDESRLFLAKSAARRPIVANSLSNMDSETFERMLQHYDAAMRSGDLAEIRWRALTAEEYWIPSVRVAEAQSRAGGSVWMYRFDKPAKSGLFEGCAAHVSELPYVWNNPDDPELAPLTAGFDPVLAARMHAAWVSFIAGDVPGAPGLPPWPRYDERTRATMIFDTASRVENDPSGAERRLWSRLFLAGPTH